jgi:hypothetical protein
MEIQVWEEEVITEEEVQGDEKASINGAAYLASENPPTVSSYGPTTTTITTSPSL